MKANTTTFAALAVGDKFIEAGICNPNLLEKLSSFTYGVIGGKYALNADVFKNSQVIKK